MRNLLYIYCTLETGYDFIIYKEQVPGNCHLGRGRRCWVNFEPLVAEVNEILYFEILELLRSQV